MHGKNEIEIKLTLTVDKVMDFLMYNKGKAETQPVYDLIQKEFEKYQEKIRAQEDYTQFNVQLSRFIDSVACLGNPYWTNRENFIIRSILKQEEAIFSLLDKCSIGEIHIPEQPRKLDRDYFKWNRKTRTLSKL